MARGDFPGGATARPDHLVFTVLPTGHIRLLEPSFGMVWVVEQAGSPGYRIDREIALSIEQGQRVDAVLAPAMAATLRQEGLALSPFDPAAAALSVPAGPADNRRWWTRLFHRQPRRRISMSVELGSSPTKVTALVAVKGGAADTTAQVTFQLSGAVAGDGTPIDDPSTVATLTDNGDATCTVAEASGAPASASVNLDAIAVDPAGSPPVSSADSGKTLTFTTAAPPLPVPETNVAEVDLQVDAGPESAAVSDPAAAADGEAAALGLAPAAPVATNEAGWPVAESAS